jgi:chorismate mutase/prephenate dehydratase
MTEFSKDDLTRCRERIDEIDLQLLDLLNQRTAIVEDIGRVKQTLQMAIYEPSREEQVYSNLQAHNRGPLSEDALRRIFERIIDEMRAVQKVKMEAGRK